MKTALITGITGQDGAYLAEFPIRHKGYTAVYGGQRRASLINTQRIDHLYEDPRDPHPKTYTTLWRFDRLN